MSNVSVFPNSMFVAILYNITMANKDWLCDINNICITTNLHPSPLTALSLSLLSFFHGFSMFLYCFSYWLLALPFWSMFIFSAFHLSIFPPFYLPLPPYLMLVFCNFWNPSLSLLYYTFSLPFALCLCFSSFHFLLCLFYLFIFCFILFYWLFNVLLFNINIFLFSYSPSPTGSFYSIQSIFNVLLFHIGISFLSLSFFY